MIKLYDYWRSSASYRVRIALAFLELDWTSVPVNLLDGSHRATDNLARNPQGLVPSLDIDGLMLTQSLAIIEYLNDTRGGGLLPDDPVLFYLTAEKPEDDGTGQYESSDSGQ